MSYSLACFFLSHDFCGGVNCMALNDSLGHCSRPLRVFFQNRSVPPARGQSYQPAAIRRTAQNVGNCPHHEYAERASEIGRSLQRRCRQTGLLAVAWRRAGLARLTNEGGIGGPGIGPTS
jgi:hypothetical protein